MVYHVNSMVFVQLFQKQDDTLCVLVADYIEHPWCQQSTDYDSGFFTSYFEYIIYYIISKLFRQDIQKYKSLIPHVSAAIQLRKYPLKGDTIQYICIQTQGTTNLFVE